MSCPARRAPSQNVISPKMTKMVTIAVFVVPLNERKGTTRIIAHKTNEVINNIIPNDFFIDEDSFKLQLYAFLLRE
jgi:hypothetical protein